MIEKGGTEISAVARELGLQHKTWTQPLIEPDGLERYTEVDAPSGSLGRFCGAKLMDLLLYYAGRSRQ
jgi:hypothetical protein